MVQAWTERALTGEDVPLLARATLGNLNWNERRFTVRDVEERPEFRHYTQLVPERGDFGFVAERSGRPITAPAWCTGGEVRPPASQFGCA